MDCRPNEVAHCQEEVHIAHADNAEVKLVAEGLQDISKGGREYLSKVGEVRIQDWQSKVAKKIEEGNKRFGQSWCEGLVSYDDIS